MYGYHIIICHVKKDSIKNISEACQNNQKRCDATERPFGLTKTVEGFKYESFRESKN